jgi:hypothetical protein
MLEVHRHLLQEVCNRETTTLAKAPMHLEDCMTVEHRMQERGRSHREDRIHRPSTAEQTHQHLHFHSEAFHRPRGWEDSLGNLQGLQKLVGHYCWRLGGHSHSLLHSEDRKT